MCLVVCLVLPQQFFGKTKKNLERNFSEPPIADGEIDDRIYSSRSVSLGQLTGRWVTDTARLCCYRLLARVCNLFADSFESAVECSVTQAVSSRALYSGDLNPFCNRRRRDSNRRDRSAPDGAVASMQRKEGQEEKSFLDLKKKRLSLARAAAAAPRRETNSEKRNEKKASGPEPL